MTTAIKHYTGLDEISTLLNSRRRCVLVDTFEEERVQEELKLLGEEKGYHVFSWSITAGLYDAITGEQIKKIHDPIKIMDHIQEYTDIAMFILKDFHDIWSNFQAKRKLRDVLESTDRIYKPILLMSPQASIPMELEKLITVVKYELPTREQVIEQLEGMEQYLRHKELPVPEGRERDAIIHSLVGMTQTEIKNVLKKSVSKNRRIDLAEITAEKEQVIRKTGLLEYITKLGDMSNVGGMDVIKTWLEDAYYAFDPEARKYNIDPVRGAVLAGFPGTGKSAFSKAVAYMWNLPLLKMSLSTIMDSKVGQSEKNIVRALKLAEQVSPCVLWIDELEKGLAGISSSERSDSGTLSRVVQELLTWLSEKEAPVFVIGTANDVTKLPPELTRAGRFDEIFFVSLPHEEEREEILKIHLRKRGYQFTDLYSSCVDFENGTIYLRTIRELAAQMVDFSGAEIEAVVAEAGRRAYASFRKGERDTHYIQRKDLEEQINQMIPLSKRNPGLLTELRAWAKTSAKCASSKEHAFIHGTQSNESKSKLRVVDFAEIDLD